MDTLQGIFSTAHEEWRESQTTTAGAVFQSGNHAYQLANQTYQNETIKAIANLATATASDRAMVTALTATNSARTTDCNATHSQLLIALQDLAKLHVTVADLRKQLSAAGINSSGSSPNHYCLMCGTRCDHTSQKCPTPATYHQKDATRHDKKGGTHKNYNLAPWHIAITVNPKYSFV